MNDPILKLAIKFEISNTAIEPDMAGTKYSITSRPSIWGISHSKNSAKMNAGINKSKPGFNGWSIWMRRFLYAYPVRKNAAAIKLGALNMVFIPMVLRDITLAKIKQKITPHYINIC